MQRKKLSSFLALACGLLAALPAHALQVVATLPSLAALAKEVAGPHAQVEAMLSPRQDPHYADAKPSLVLALNRADLLIFNGLELEVGWLPGLVRQARNPKILPGAAGSFDASRFVQKLHVPATLDRAQGDIHPGGNPHFAWDPRAGAAIAEGLGRALGQADPAHAADYQKNAAELAGRLRALAASEQKRFQALAAPQRQVAVYHDSLVYLVDWLGLQQVTTVEPRPGIPPDPAHLAKVIGQLKAVHGLALLQEEYYPRSASDQVVRLAGGRVAVLQGGARFSEGQRYDEYVRGLAAAVFAAITSK